jgi:pimeloyl-ACP methyl ester carboxylesterase
LTSNGGIPRSGKVYYGRHRRESITVRFDGRSAPQGGLRAVQAALPDCRVVVMPGQRHAAMDTATELFTGEVLAFLEG